MYTLVNIRTIRQGDEKVENFLTKFFLNHFGNRSSAVVAHTQCTSPELFKCTQSKRRERDETLNHMRDIFVRF